MAILVYMSSNIRQHNQPIQRPADLLAQLGLNDHEIRIYLDLLQHGPRPIAVLAKRAGLSRTNGYSVIQGLEEKGVCYSSGASYGKKIHAHNPEALVSIIKNKKRELDELERGLEGLKQLVLMSENSGYSGHRVTYLEGIENIKKIFTLMTEPGVSHLYGVGSELELETYVGYETLLTFHERRKREKIRFSILRAGPDRLPGEAFHNDDTYLREVRIRPKGKVRLKSQLYLFNNTIIFLNLFDKPFATVIENEPMFVMFHSWFDFIWSASEPTVSREHSGSDNKQKIKKVSRGTQVKLKKK